mmetsp:Transcript_41094/g.118193  ORF Transcript_41094/g.118193 Transcript_41094/m.118193 type:complete len:249 (+) Transcript_41094:272-1018(+)
MCAGDSPSRAPGRGNVGARAADSLRSRGQAPALRLPQGGLERSGPGCRRMARGRAIVAAAVVAAAVCNLDADRADGARADGVASAAGGLPAFKPQLLAGAGPHGWSARSLPEGSLHDDADAFHLHAAVSGSPVAHATAADALAAAGADCHAAAPALRDLRKGPRLADRREPQRVGLPPERGRPLARGAGVRSWHRAAYPGRRARGARQEWPRRHRRRRRGASAKWSPRRAGQPPRDPAENPRHPGGLQ